MSKLNLSFRSANDLDVERIHSWLKEHAHRKVHGSFLCNWEMTLKVHDNNQLLVATIENEPIAYIWKDFGILEVREDFRNKGVGKALVDHAMKHAANCGKYSISVECKPESSIPFWRKMGFEFHIKNKASFIFEKYFDSPINGSPIIVEIMFYPEQVKWTPQTPPIKSFSPPAILDHHGILHLPYRVATYDSREQYNGDVVIKICIEGENVYFDKAKYPEAKEIGVAYNSGVFYIEKLFNLRA